MSAPASTPGAASWPSSAATGSQATSIISNPDTDPHDYEPTRPTRGSIAGARLFVENGIGYDTWAAQGAGRQPRLRPPGRRRRRSSIGDAGRRQPAPLVLPDRRRRRSPTRSPPASAALDPADAGVLRRPRDSEFEDTGLADVPPADRRHPGASTRAHRSARARASSPRWPTRWVSTLLTPPAFLQGDQRGRRPVAPRTRPPSTRRSRDQQIKVYVYNRQNSTPGRGRAGARGPRGRHPGRRL